ncbi:MAG TPA: CHAD domain-containing protein, partial [Hyphomicrobiaceae bacterium]|nr:CHAD domain-containing protein [Hyphomicrobiaceae bacterium]
RSVYFDTPDHRLRAKGLSLRVRRVGRRWVQTLKAGTEVQSGLSNPIEVEGEVHGTKPELEAVHDGAVRRQIKKALDGSALVPVFETVVHRTTRRLRAGKNGEIELALDEGVVRSPAGSREIREAELELKSGPADSLLTVAEALFGDEHIRLAEKSKAERGYDLALGRPTEALKPLFASEPDLDKTQSCAAALRAILKVVADQVLHNCQVVAETDEPEGAHQLRIGLRRLRSALRVFRPVADSHHLRELDEKARDLGRVVGELRDADVLLDEVVAPAMASGYGEPGFARLREALASERSGKRDHVKASLLSPRWSCFQLKLALLPKVGDWSAAASDDGALLALPVRKHARKALGRSWREVAQWAERIEELTIEERHQMRKSLKSLRYAVEFFQSIFPAMESRRFLKELKWLQEIFGYLNDVAMAKKAMELSAKDAGAELQRAMGYVLGWHAARADEAWTSARVRWRRLESAPRFWEA